MKNFMRLKNRKFKRTIASITATSLIALLSSNVSSYIHVTQLPVVEAKSFVPTFNIGIEDIVEDISIDPEEMRQIEENKITDTSYETEENYERPSKAIAFIEENKDFKPGVFVITKECDVYDNPDENSERVIIDTYEEKEQINTLGLYGDYVYTDESTYVHVDNIERYVEPLTSISTNTEVSSKSGATIEELDAYLEDFNLGGLGEAVLEVEEEYGINAFFTVGVMRLESGNGTSKLSINKNNLFGLAAYDGSAYHSGLSFETKSDCVKYFGKLIKNHYIDEGRTTANSINTKYCSSKTWARKISSISNHCSNSISETREAEKLKDYEVMYGKN